MMSLARHVEVTPDTEQVESLHFDGLEAHFSRVLRASDLSSCLGHAMLSMKSGLMEIQRQRSALLSRPNTAHEHSARSLLSSIVQGEHLRAAREEARARAGAAPTGDRGDREQRSAPSAPRAHGQAAVDAKELGNRAFAAGRHAEAHACYTRALWNSSLKTFRCICSRRV